MLRSENLAASRYISYEWLIAVPFEMVQSTNYLYATGCYRTPWIYLISMHFSGAPVIVFALCDDLKGERVAHMREIDYFFEQNREHEWL